MSTTLPEGLPFFNLYKPKTAHWLPTYTSPLQMSTTLPVGLPFFNLYKLKTAHWLYTNHLYKCQLPYQKGFPYSIYTNQKQPTDYIQITSMMSTTLPEELPFFNLYKPKTAHWLPTYTHHLYKCQLPYWKGFPSSIYTNQKQPTDYIQITYMNVNYPPGRASVPNSLPTNTTH